MKFALKDKYPIDTIDQVKTANQYFKDNLTKFAPPLRGVAAYNLEKRAGQLGVYLNEPWIKNYARGFKKVAKMSPSFEYDMETRKTACKNGRIEIDVGGKKLKGEDIISDMLKEAKAGRFSTSLAVAAISKFDKLAGLEVEYDRTIADPLMTVYGDNVNPEYDAVKIAAKISLTNYDLLRMSHEKDSLEKIASVFTKKVSTEFARHPVKTFYTMSNVEKNLFNEAFNG